MNWSEAEIKQFSRFINEFDLASALWPEQTSGAVTASEVEYFGDNNVETFVEILSRVILYNDDHHTFDEVIEQVIKATGCSGTKAEGIAWEVHIRGKACVCEGDLFECLRVSSILEEIALHTQVLT